MDNAGKNDTENKAGARDALSVYDDIRLTTEEQIQKLQIIRDQSLEWWAERVQAKQATGMGAAQDSFNKAVHYLEKFSHEGGARGKIEIAVAGFDPRDIEWTKDSRSVDLGDDDTPQA
jgi:hypothetical protein